MNPLDYPVGDSLRGAHAGLAIVAGRAARYPADVCVFACLAEPSVAALADLTGIVGSGEFVGLINPDLALGPTGWKLLMELDVTQMVCASRLEEAERTPQTLGPRDVPEMLALVEATRPGPFAVRTIEMGRYLGFRSGGRLVAMGGERLHPTGFTEVSAICTDPAFRGRGLGEALVRAVAGGIQKRGEVPFLHAMVDSPAIPLYQRLGFRERRRSRLAIVQRG